MNLAGLKPKFVVFDETNQQQNKRTKMKTKIETCIEYAHAAMVTDGERRAARAEHAALVAVAEAAEVCNEAEESGDNERVLKARSKMESALAKLAAVREK